MMILKGERWFKISVNIFIWTKIVKKFANKKIWLKGKRRLFKIWEKINKEFWWNILNIFHKIFLEIRLN